MKLFYFLFSALLLIAPTTLKAQDADFYDTTAADATRFYVSDVTFSQNSYQPGELVTGTFIFHNLSDEIITSAQYRVELVELFDDGNGVYPSDALDASVGISLPIIAPGASTVAFSYTLPTHIPEGTIGVLIQTYIGEMLTPAAMEYVPLTLTGSRAVYMERAATMIVNEEEFYETLAGPTVKPSETASLEVYVANTASEPVQLQPTLRIVEGSTSTGEEVFSEQLTEVSVSAGVEHTFTVPIPVSTLAPGVYTLLVSVSHVKTGVPAFAPLEARIVIAGLTPKIESVTYNALDLKPLDASFDVTVGYLDTPLNFRTYADGTPQDDRATWAANDMSVEEWVKETGMSVRVRIENTETGALVGEQEVPFTTSHMATVSFGRLIGSTNVLVTVTLLQYGEEVDTFSETLALATEQYPAWKKLWYEYPIVTLITGVVLVCLSVLLLGVTLLRRRSNASVM